MSGGNGSSVPKDIVSHKQKQYFEEAMSRNDAVSRFEEVSHRVYDIYRRQGDVIRVCLSGKYVFGVSDYADTVASVSGLRCVVMSSSFRKYSDDAKAKARLDQVGVFSMGEFFRALKLEKFWLYGV